MKKRTLGRTGLGVTEIGLGCEHLVDKKFEEVDRVVNSALDAGINIFDVFMPQDEVRDFIGRAIGSRRSQVYLQGHLGACLDEKGQYLKNTDLQAVENHFTRFLKLTRSEVVDIGMLHFIDSEQDYKDYFEGGILDYALRLKEKGIIRAIGMSSHVPQVARRAVETGAIDVLMFSINPIFDLFAQDVDLDSLFAGKDLEKLKGMDRSRTELYETCEKHGTAITVMKALGGGWLLKPNSPFGAPMTVTQCAAYALDRPAVASVLIGCRTEEEVLAAVEADASPDRDYSAIIGNSPKYALTGKCMYCNHCLPCPVNLDIASVTKYLHLAASNGHSPTLQAHYDSLPVKASSCAACGSCEEKCPFGVAVIENMKAAKEMFE